MCVCVCAHVCMHACVCVYVYVCMCVHPCVQIRSICRCLCMYISILNVIVYDIMSIDYVV